MILCIEILPVIGCVKMIKLLTLAGILTSLPFNRISIVRVVTTVFASIIGLLDEFDVTLMIHGEFSGSLSSSSVPSASSVVPEEVDQLEQAPRSNSLESQSESSNRAHQADRSRSSSDLSSSNLASDETVMQNIRSEALRLRRFNAT